MKQQRGMALISVLLISTVIVSILASIYYRQSLAQDRVFTSLMLDKASLIGISAEGWVGDLLLRDLNRSSRDSLDEEWAQQLPALPVEGGLLQGRIIDLQGRLNLNRFTAYTTEQFNQAQQNPKSDLQLVKRLAQHCGVALNDRQLSALIDWQDEDDTPLPLGAESAEYQLLEPPYRAANTELVDLHELLLLQGFDSNNVKRLRPCVSLLPRDGSAINVNTASAPVLMALSEHIDAGVASQLIQQRELSPWNTEQEFYAALADILSLENYKAARTLIYAKGYNPVAISSHYFLLEMELSLEGIEFHLSTLLERKEQGSSFVVRPLQRSIQIDNDTTTDEA